MRGLTLVESIAAVTLLGALSATAVRILQHSAMPLAPPDDAVLAALETRARQIAADPDVIGGTFTQSTWSEQLDLEEQDLEVQVLVRPSGGPRGFWIVLSCQGWRSIRFAPPAVEAISP